jgi:hypothetical protein
MEVSVGWNTEFGRDKFQVTLDEVDLARICNDYQIPVAALTTPEAFALLRAYANWLASQEAVRFDSERQADVLTHAQAVTATVSAILDRLNPGVPAAA